LLLLDQLSERKLGFSGGAIVTGFVVLFYGLQNTLNRMAVGRVAANFEFAGQPVQEAGGGNARQAVLCYASLLTPKHVAMRAIHAPDLTRCKDGTYWIAVQAMAILCLFVMNLIAIF
jgi:hypothetical protein